MAKNIEITFEAKLVLDSIKKSISEVQAMMESGMSKFSIPKNIEDDFVRTFKKLNLSVEDFSSKVSQGFTSMSDISKAKTALDSLTKQYIVLSDKIEELQLNPEKLIPADAQKWLAGLQKAYDAIAVSISDASIAAEKNALEEKIKDAEKSAEDLHNKIEQNKEALGKVQTNKNGLEDKIEAAKVKTEELHQSLIEITKQQKEMERAPQQKYDTYQKRKEEVKALKEEIAKLEKQYKSLKETDSKTLEDGTSLASITGTIGARRKKLKRIEAEYGEFTTKDKVKTATEDIKLSEEYQKTEQQLRQINSAIKENEKEIQNLSREKDAAAREENKYSEAIKKDEVSYNEAKQNIDGLKSSLSSLVDDLKVKKLEELRSKFAELGIPSEQLSNLKTLEDFNLLLQSLKTDQLKEVAPLLKTMGLELESVEGKIKVCKSAIEENAEAMQKENEAAREVEGIKNRITQFFGLANAVNLARKAIQNAFSTIKELDKTMTETAVVTDFSISDMWAQLPEYTRRANELGVATNSAYAAATLYYQQGLKTNEVIAVSTETLKMARIAGIEAAQATDYMTAALRGFNMEVNETSAQRVNDVYSKLAAITASDTQEISVAMTKVASLAHNANMEFETTAAFLAQIVETTRESAETAGTALKTVVSRFSEVKKLYSSGDLMGTDEEGQEIDVNKISTALRSAGINLNEYFAGLKGLDDIFMELAQKWDSLDGVQQRYIATMAAGSRQQSRFIAMMSNYQRTIELVGAANNSAGASQEQFEKTLDSLESKLAQLSNAWNEFTMSLANSDLVKVVVDIATTILNVINGLTSSFGSAGNAMAKLILSIGGLKIGKVIFNKFFDNLVSQFFDGGKRAGDGFASGLKEKINKKNLEVFKPGSLKTLSSSIGANLQQALEGVDVKSLDLEKLQVGVKNQLENLMGGPDFIVNSEKINEGLAKIGRGNISEGIRDLNGLLNETGEQLKVDAEIAQTDARSATQSLTNGFLTASAAVAGASMALGFLANNLEKLGMPKVANVAKNLSTGFGVLSGVLIALPPLFTAIGISIEAIPVIGWIAAIATVGIAIVSALETAEDRVKRLEKEAESAKDKADAAKQSYEELLSGKDKYDETQKSLSNLIKGTEEWNKALIEANNTVLELLQNYPELSKYLSKNGGQLTISPAGFEEVSKQQLAAAEKANKIAFGKMAQTASAKADTVFNQAFSRLQVARGSNDELEKYLRTEADEDLKKSLESGSITSEFYSEQLKNIQDFLIDLDNAREDIKSNLKAGLLSSADLDTKDLDNANQIIDKFVDNMAAEFGEGIEDLSEEELVTRFDSFIGLVNNALALAAQKDIDVQEVLNVLDGKVSEIMKHYEDLASGQQKFLLSIGISEKSYDQIVDNINTKIEEVEAKLKSSFGLNIPIEDKFNLSVVQSIMNQAEKMGADGGAAYIKAFRDGILSGKFDDIAVSYLSSIDWSDMNQAMSAFDFMQDLNLDDSEIKNFWNVAVEGANAYYHSIEEVMKLHSSLQNSFKSIDELKERLEEGKATYEDVLELSKAGFDVSDFELTSEGWKLTSDKIKDATKALQEYRLENAKMAYENQVQKDARLQSLLEGPLASVVTQENGEYKTNFDISKLNVGQKTSIEKALISEGYLTPGQVIAEGWNAAQTALDKYVQDLNSADAIEEIAKKGVIFAQGQTYESGQDALTAGVETEVFDAKIMAEDLEDVFKGLKEEFDGAGKQIESYDRVLKALAIDLNKNAKAIDAMNKVVSDNADTFKYAEKNSVVFLKALGEFKTAAKEAFGETIDQDTWEAMWDSIANSENFEKVRENISNLGSKDAKEAQEAFDYLGKAIGDTFLKTLNLGIDTENSIRTLVSNLDNLDPFTIEGHADFQDIFNQLAVMMNGAKQAQAYLESLNYEIDWELTKSDSVPLPGLHEDDNGLLVPDTATSGAARQQARLSLPKYRMVVKKKNAGGTTTTPPSTGGSGGGSGSGSSKADKDWENPYDWLYNLTEKINKKLREREKLERNYQKLLDVRRGTGKQLLENSNKELENLEQQRKLQAEMLQKRETEMKRELQKYSNMSKYGSYDFNSGLIQINWDVIDKVKDTDTGKKIEDYISKLEEIRDQMWEVQDALDAIEDQVEEIKLRGKEEFRSLEDRVKEALINERQAEIDELSAINDSITEANDKLIDSMQKEIAKDRQDRENQKTEQEIADKQRRLEYLRQDTSGANSLEILKLEKEISEAQESYTDQLIDQKISELQEQNDAAALQRQEQIDIMQAQLDHAIAIGDIAQEAMNLVIELMNNGGVVEEGSRLAELLLKSDEVATLTNFAKAEWWDDLQKEAALAMVYYKAVLSKYLSRDYSKEIQDAVERGDYNKAAELEKERNYKIDLMGYSYDKTYSYETGDWSRWKKKKTKKYKTGGLADYTGPAWLDGTPSRPEIVLNQKDSKNFMVLKDVLSNLLGGSQAPGTENSGDNYFDVDINVEKISDDYDVDKIAGRVKDLIRQDAVYRNVNVINNKR